MQGNVGSIPGWGAKIPHAVWHSQKIQEKKKQKSTEQSLDLGNLGEHWRRRVSHLRGGQRECTDSALEAKDR